MKALWRIALASLFFTQLTLSGLAQSGIITTYVGPTGSPVSGASALNQFVDQTYAVAPDGVGGFYFVSSQNRVYRVTATGILTIAAGAGAYGFSGDGGAATAAQLGSPQGLAVDSAGNLYIADTGNNRIRKVTTAGVISTVAGNGALGFSGDSGLATAAQLSHPYGVTVDTVGNLYIADTFNSRIRKVTAAGVISTIAGNGLPGFSGDGGQATAAQLYEPIGLALDNAGNLFISDVMEERIRKITAAGVISTVAGNGTTGFSGDGSQATAAALFYPLGIAVDDAGNLYISDSGNQRIREVTPAGVISTVAGNGGRVFSGDGVAATSTSLWLPQSVAVDAAGNLYIADTDNNRIRMVTTAGVISTVAGRSTAGFSGDGGQSTAAQLNVPQGVTVDNAGNLYIADGSIRIRKVNAEGVISTFAGNGTPGFSGDGGPASAAQLSSASRVTSDSAGNLYIEDNFRIRKVTAATGIISTVAGNGTPGFNGDGGRATEAELLVPLGIIVDANGNLFIADSGNHRIRKVTPSGVITTVAGNGVAGSSGDGGQATAAELGEPRGVAVDAAGNLYIADRTNGKIRKVNSAGVISTLPDVFNSAEAVTVDKAGNLYVADSGNNAIRMITTAGDFSAFAGNGVAGFSGDGGQATLAQLNGPSDVVVDAGGAVYIADTGNNRIRRVSIGNGVANSVYFAQVAVGGGYTTTFTITNIGATAASGTVTLTDQQANPFTVNGALTDSFGTIQPAVAGPVFSFSVPSGGTIFLSVTTDSMTKSGWAEVDSFGGALSAVATYDYSVGSTVHSIVGVPQAQQLQYMTIPVDNNTVQNKQTAYGIANPGSQPVIVKFAMVGQDGTVVDDSFSVTLNPGQQIARYLWQDLGRKDFKGSLVLRGESGATFIAVALSDKQGMLTAIPLISGKAPGVPD